MEGYAILVGVNELNQPHYPSNYNISSVDKDFDLIIRILNDTSSYNGNIKTIGGSVGGIKQDAKWSDFIAGIKPHQEYKGTENRFLVIYILCHGALLEVKGSNKKWTFLCFQDHMVTEAELREEIRKISPLITPFIIIQSCYSGGTEFGIRKMNEFQTVYNNNSNLSTDKYYDLVNILRNYPTTFEDRVCLYYSTKKAQPGPGTVAPGQATDFMTILRSTWKNYKATQSNYFTFFEGIFKPNFSNHFKPTKHLVSESPVNELFYKNYPFYFNGNSTPLKQNFIPFQSLVELDITENTASDGTVKITMNTPHIEYYYTDSYTMSEERDSMDPRYFALKQDILQIDEDLLEDIEHIGVFFVNTHGVNGSLFPSTGGPSSGIAVNYMKSITDAPPFNALIVICVTNMNNQIVGYKRTKGKVSNSIGG